MELKGREKQIVQERIRKLNELKESGTNPFAHRFDSQDKRIQSKILKEKYSKLKEEETSTSFEFLAGRIMTKRSFGKLAFCELQDLSGSIQLVFQKGETPESAMEIFKKMDAGDIVGLKGKPTRTKTGEISVLIEEFEILTKSIYPLPDKHAGLKNDEERLRKRYLDVIMNEDVKEMFVKKQKFWAATRNFLITKGFLEIETPILENSAGGAAATPFATHHNALDLDVYLRISMGELWQKKALVAGFEKTFEIGRQFRNEGMDAEHLQDYTQMEFYWGYANFEDGMKLVEALYKEIAMATLGKLDFEANEHKIDLSKKWERYDFETLIKDKTGVDIYKSDKKEIMKKLKELKMDFDPEVDKWRMVDLLWKYCRKQLSGPGFLIGQPVELTPLAKRSQKDPRKVEQFQVILGGSEVGNGYSELNDPIDQETRFKEQRQLGEAGDSEAMEHDESFVEALKYAMPPACGFGFSERLFGFMMNKPLRECVLFPLMRPEVLFLEYESGGEKEGYYRIDANILVEETKRFRELLKKLETMMNVRINPKIFEDTVKEIEKEFNVKITDRDKKTIIVSKTKNLF
jgi:lysyl-tRNA synthetase class 2